MFTMRLPHLFVVSSYLLLGIACMPTEETGSDTKVIGGAVVRETDKVPGALAAVALAVPNRSGTFDYFCSGNIVGRSWIMTAQHCVDKRAPSSFMVVFGTDAQKVSSRAEAGAESFRRVEAIHVVPGYTSPSAAFHEFVKEYGHYQIRLQNDVALIKLAGDIPSPYRPARLARDHELSPGAILSLVSYGSSRDPFLEGGVRRTTNLRFSGQKSSVLNGGKLFGRGARVYHLRKTVETEYMCRGDSGGGLYRYAADGSVEIVAINSYTKGSNKVGFEVYDCPAGHAYAFFVPDYLSWAQGIMGVDSELEALPAAAASPNGPSKRPPTQQSEHGL